MSDHEFEKKVQQKMDDLKLRPSDGVWAEVEKNLRRGKRRRRTLLWLPLVGILLTAGGYLIYNGSNKPQDSALATKNQAAEKAIPSPTADLPATSSSSNDHSSSKNNTEPSAQNSTLTSSNDTQPVDAAPVASQKDNTVVIENRPSVQQKAVTDNSKLRAADRNNQGIERGQKKMVSKVPDSKRTIVKERVAKVPSSKEPAPKQQVPKQDATTKEPSNKDSATTTIDSTAIVNNTIDTDNQIDSSAKAVSVQPIDSLANQAVTAKLPAKKKPSKNSKFQVGLTAGGGVANISEGSLFEILQAVRVEDLAQAAPVFQGPPAAPAPEPSPIDPGATFSIGGFVQTHLSKRITLSVGLQYSYFSVNTSVGRKVDSIVAYNYGTANSRLTSSYYSADNSRHDYTNKYHFVELPITAGFQLNRSRKLPVVLDAGVSISRLINTNALHFDGISRVYYENDDFFNKTQLSLNTGLNIGLFQQSAHPLWIGPQLRYLATGLVRKEVLPSAGQQHIWSVGLNVKMLLKK